MNLKSNNYFDDPTKEILWTQAPNCNNDSINQWLTKPYILTQAISNTYGQVLIQLLSEHVINSLLIRKVFIWGIDPNYNSKTCVCYAKSLIPWNIYNDLQLSNLKNNPLGLSALYDNPNITRGDFEYTQFLFGSVYHDEINQMGLKCIENLYARRSFFDINQENLEIIEVFLPNLKTLKL